MIRRYVLLLFVLVGSPALSQEPTETGEIATDSAATSDASFSTEESSAVTTPLRPRQLLEKMVAAQRRQGYSGAIAYERNGALSTFSVTTRSNDTALLQSLQPLNRESSSRLVFTGCNQGPASESVGQLAQLYNLHLTGESRVAGRPAHELLLLPLDPYRYGYGFSIDQSSMLMLRSVTFTPQRQPIERMEFVNLELSSAIDGEPQPNDCESRHLDNSGWLAATVPAGFSLLSDRLDENGQVTLVYSDGLSHLSIFVHPVESADLPSLTTQLGATSLLMTYAETDERLVRVTLVGEVPMRSLEMVAGGLQYRPVETSSESAE